jgi:hypothetical protein
MVEMAALVDKASACVVHQPFFSGFEAGLPDGIY